MYSRSTRLHNIIRQRVETSVLEFDNITSKSSLKTPPPRRDKSRTYHSLSSTTNILTQTRTLVYGYKNE